MNKMKKIAVDMDGVIANTPLQVVKWYKQIFGVELNLKAIEGQFFLDAIDPTHRTKAREMYFQKGFFADIPVMLDAQEVMKELSKKYELFITTASTQFPNSYNDKQEWLAMHFPFIDWKHTVFCGSKSIIQADYMIDDFAYNLDDFVGEGLLFTSYHNVNETGYHRVNNWKEAGDYLL